MAIFVNSLKKDTLLVVSKSFLKNRITFSEKVQLVNESYRFALKRR